MAKKMFILWWILFVLMGIINKTYIIIFTSHNGFPPTETLSGYVVIIILLVILVFMPLMYLVYRRAKQENRKGIRIASLFILAYLIIWIVASLDKWVF